MNSRRKNSVFGKTPLAISGSDAQRRADAARRAPKIDPPTRSRLRHGELRVAGIDRLLYRCCRDPPSAETSIDLAYLALHIEFLTRNKVQAFKSARQ